MPIFLKANCSHETKFLISCRALEQMHNIGIMQVRICLSAFFSVHKKYSRSSVWISKRSHQNLLHCFMKIIVKSTVAKKIIFSKLSVSLSNTYFKVFFTLYSSYFWQWKYKFLQGQDSTEFLFVALQNYMFSMSVEGVNEIWVDRPSLRLDP